MASRANQNNLVISYLFKENKKIHQYTKGNGKRNGMNLNNITLLTNIMMAGYN